MRRRFSCGRSLVTHALLLFALCTLTLGRRSRERRDNGGGIPSKSSSRRGGASCSLPFRMEALKETLLRSDFDRVRQHPKYKVCGYSSGSSLMQRGVLRAWYDSRLEMGEDAGRHRSILPPSMVLFSVACGCRAYLYNTQARASIERAPIQSQFEPETRAGTTPGRQQLVVYDM